jgi:hypothetical protein
MAQQRIDREWWHLVVAKNDLEPACGHMVAHLPGWGGDEPLAGDGRLDDSNGMLRWKQQADHYADWGLTFGNPDFVVYARSYGASGSVVTAADGLVRVLEAAFAAGGVELVAVLVNYSHTSASSSRNSARPTPAAAAGGVLRLPSRMVYYRFEARHRSSEKSLISGVAMGNPFFSSPALGLIFCCR